MREISRARPPQTRVRIACPDCGGLLRTRSSRSVTSTFRQAVLACENVDTCGSTFGAALEVTHRISPGARPNPACQLRTAPPRRRAVPANDALPAVDPSRRGPEVPPPPANDTEAIGTATG